MLPASSASPGACDLVAQSVEHLTFNQVVAGSIPAQITIFSLISELLSGFAGDRADEGFVGFSE